jgi:effector-binding domain-containing protein
MKFLKWLLIVVLAIAALVLIIPLFFPATVEFSASKEIAVSPIQAFVNLATYTDRNKWDPWLPIDPEAKWSAEPREGYVGSTYSWNGKKVGTGQEMIDSVVFGRYIAENLRFGNDSSGSLVEWNFEPAGTGTNVTWSFRDKTKYPIERMMFNLYKGGLKKSFEKGLDNLKAYLESNPPVLSTLGKIERGRIEPMFTLVIKTRGTMQEMSQQIPQLYEKLYAEMNKQGLQITGAPFCHYLSFDQASGISEYLTGIHVSGKGKDAGDIKAVNYPSMDVIQAIHYGPYDDLMNSYNKIMDYIAVNQLKITGQNLEIYYTDPSMEPDVTKIQTLIAFPLR